MVMRIKKRTIDYCLILAMLFIMLLFWRDILRGQDKSVVVYGGQSIEEFATISEAISYVRTNAIQNPTVYIRKGVYHENINIQGIDNIMLLGESKEECIIICDKMKYSCPTIEAAGNFEIRGLTIKMVQGSDDWIPSYDMGDVANTFPGYAVHIEGDSIYPNLPATGKIINCNIYSEMFPAIGAGLHNNQTLLFSNCSFVRKVTDERFLYDKCQGAFVAHPSNVETDQNQHLIVIACLFETNKGNSGNIYPFTSGVKGFTFTAIDNNFRSTDDGLCNFDYNKEWTLLSPESKGNSCKNLNYE